MEYRCLCRLCTQNITVALARYYIWMKDETRKWRRRTTTGGSEKSICGTRISSPFLTKLPLQYPVAGTPFQVSCKNSGSCERKKRTRIEQLQLSDSFNCVQRVKLQSCEILKALIPSETGGEYEVQRQEQTCSSITRFNK